MLSQVSLSYQCWCRLVSLVAKRFLSALKVLLMNMEQFLMTQIFGGGLAGAASGWLQVVFLAFLIAIPVFRPESIKTVAMYRRACLCFGISIIVPGAVSVLMMAAMLPTAGAGGYGNSGSPLLIGQGMVRMLHAGGPILFGLSVIFALKAVVPGFIPPVSSRPSRQLYPDGPADGDSNAGETA
jgi:hypothetical protein